ncbi:retropepsin-like aspartic protease [Aurantiacibacter sediminis]|nr:retropepsin-like aspartic protease [Aurantiacibacter sediminis]
MAQSDRVAAAFLGLMDRREGSADAMMQIVRSMPAGELKDRMFFIAAGQLIAEHRWADVAAASEANGMTNLADFARPYANWPDASVDYNGVEVTEVPFDGLRIPAQLNGVDIEIAFDTGAPGVGVHRDFIDLLETDGSAPQTYALPAFDIVATKHHALVGSLTIGDITLRNVAASVGLPPETPEDQAKFERMDQIVGRYDIIMGLDALRPFFEVIEFDYNRDVVRLIRRDPRPRAEANMLMGAGRKPLIRMRTQNRIGNYYIDTGSYGHLLGEGAFDIRECDAQRTMTAPWREIAETRVSVGFEDQPPVEIWAQPTSVVTEPEWDLFGYIGNPRSGVYRIDVRDGHFAFEDYSSEGLDSLWPISAEREGSCAPAAPMP